MDVRLAGSILGYVTLVGLGWLTFAYRRHAREVRRLRDWSEGRDPASSSRAEKLAQGPFDSPAELAVMALIVLVLGLVVILVIAAVTHY
ncbi:MAG: hypothetical protein JOZ25_12390 [Actinobacteria bacterium]|nr:hypothetical protein [Actinomycetota bacterium]